MKNFKHIIRIFACVALLLPAVAFQSCKTDEEDLLKKVYSIPENITLKVGESFNPYLIDIDLDDTLVLPALVVDGTSVMTTDTDVVGLYRYNDDIVALAEGEGTCDLIYYNSEDEEICRINVTVLP